MTCVSVSYSMDLVPGRAGGGSFNKKLTIKRKNSLVECAQGHQECSIQVEFWVCVYQTSASGDVFQWWSNTRIDNGTPLGFFKMCGDSCTRPNCNGVLVTYTIPYMRRPVVYGSVKKVWCENGRDPFLRDR